MLPEKNTKLDYSADGYQDLVIKVYDQISDILEIRDIWEKLEDHPNVSFDFYVTVMKSRVGKSQPYVVVFFKYDEPVSMLVGRLEDKNLPFKIGYKKITSIPAKTLTIIYSGILGDKSAQMSEIQYDFLKNLLSKKVADLVVLKHLRMESHLYNLVRFSPKFYLRDFCPDISIHWRLILHGSINEYLKKFNHKKRKNLKRIEKKLNSTFPDKLQLKLFKTTNDLDMLVSACEEIAQKTYQRGLGVGFVNIKENRERLELIAKKGWLSSFLLYIEDKPVAFLITTLYKDILYGDYIGYDKTYHKYSPGTFILLKAIEISSLQQITEMDFGFGDAEYKRQLCDYNWDEATVNLYSDSFIGFRIYVMQILTIMISSLAESLLKRFNLVQKVKTKWRKFLTPSTSEIKS